LIYGRLAGSSLGLLQAADLAEEGGDGFKEKGDRKGESKSKKEKKNGERRGHERKVVY